MGGFKRPALENREEGKVVRRSSLPYGYGTFFLQKMTSMPRDANERIYSYCILVMSAHPPLFDPQHPYQLITSFTVFKVFTVFSFAQVYDHKSARYLTLGKVPYLYLQVPCALTSNVRTDLASPYRQWTAHRRITQPHDTSFLTLDLQCAQPIPNCPKKASRRPSEVPCSGPAPGVAGYFRVRYMEYLHGSTTHRR